MEQIENKTYRGKIKTFNGVFGFIESELGETSFHKNGLKSDFYPQKNDEIEFQIEPSIKKQGEMQACEIVLIKKKVNNEISEEVDNRLIGIVKWYDTIKGYGLIGTPEKVDYFLRKDDLHSRFISAGNVVVFYGKNKKGKNIAVKCKHTFGYKDWKLAFSYADKDDIVTVEFVKEEKRGWGYGTYRYTETQEISLIKSALKRVLKEKESLSFNELCFFALDLLQTKFADEGYKLVKEIVALNKISEEEKNIFLKSAYDKTTAKYQYKLFIDNLVFISEQEQSNLLQRYLTIIGNICISNYDQFKDIAHNDKISKSAKVIFIESAFENTNTEYQYKMLNDGLLILSEEKQIEFLKNYLFELGSISFSNYERIKNIVQSDRFEKKAKNIFLKSAIESSNAEFHYKILIEDNLLDIQNKTSEFQIELLQKYLTKIDIINIDSNWNVYDKNWKYNKIKFIAQSNLIEKNAKNIFLKLAFEKSTAECQYKMLFEDNLINIQNETSESQIELLSKFERLDLDKIKIISNLDKLKETVKEAFLKSAFEKSTIEIQYDMLGKYNFVNDIYFKINFLINSTQCGRMRFSKGKYGGETYFEVLENDIEYLHKNKNKQNYDIEEFYDVEHGFWSYDGGQPNSYKLSSKYEQWKEFWISILEDINNDIKSKKIFSVDSSIEDFFNIITQINDVRELFDIFGIEFNENEFKIGIIKSIEQLNLDLIENIKNYKILACIKKYNPEFYNSLFEKSYPNISKIDRLYLWLNNLNPYYNYFELVQSAWQLSNNERKLLNKRIKEYAKDERLQKFYDQIPIAEIIEKTESTKTYKCKWRNLYYKNGSIQVFFDKTTSSEDYMWDSSREEWNLLTQEYFNNRRIDDIIVTVNHNNHITKITGLEDIEVKIVIAEIRKNGTADRKTNISSSQISKIIHNISARNQCINFLASQNSDFNVLDIQELVTDDYGSLRRDVSFIFPIPNNKSNVYLIWESAEFEKSKATHIFKCSIEEVDDMEFKIKDFIESNLRTRSRLNSVENDDLKVKRELQYFCRVNHDSVEYQVWENRMREVLPFLK